MKLPSFLRKILNTEGEIPPLEVNQPLFITGCMRSGTSFLYNKLSEHPQLLKIGGELNDVWTAIGGADCSVFCEHKNEKNASYTYAANMNHYFFRFIDESKSFKRHLMRMNEVASNQGGRVFYDWGNIIPVNKSTHLINKTSYLHTLFPKSKFIFIVRDIYSQSASLKIHFEVNNKKSHNFYYKPLNELGCWSILNQHNLTQEYANQPKYPGDFSIIPEMWIKLNALAVKELSQLPEDQVKIISYEKLVNQQQVVFDEIFDFLKLEIKHKTIENKIGSKSLKYINTTTRGNPLEKWKKQLSKDEIEMIKVAIITHQKEYDKIQSAIS